MRVLENRLGAIVIARALGVGRDAALRINTLADLEPYLNEHISSGDIH